MAHTKEFAKKRIEKSAQKALMGSGYGDVFGSSAKKKAIARKMDLSPKQKAQVAVAKGQISEKGAIQRLVKHYS